MSVEETRLREEVRRLKGSVVRWQEKCHALEAQLAARPSAGEAEFKVRVEVHDTEVILYRGDGNVVARVDNHGAPITVEQVGTARRIARAVNCYGVLEAAVRAGLAYMESIKRDTLSFQYARRLQVLRDAIAFVEEMS